MTAPKPKRPSHLPHGRWLGDFEEENPLSAAEKALVAACARGEAWEPEDWDGKRPDEATPANTIRAGLIRFLLLGGDAEHPVHEDGVELHGARIDDELDLHQMQSSLCLFVHLCYFLKAPILVDASMPTLALDGSFCPGLLADGLILKGDLLLRNGFHSVGVVSLVGAEIEGSIDCCEGHFDHAKCIAINTHRATVKSGVYLRDGFKAEGEVRLIGTVIGGNIDFSDGHFFCENGKAINASRLIVGGNLFLRRANVVGTIEITTVEVGTLADDDFSCWQGGRHLLDGFHFKRIIGFTDAARRIEWLKLQREDQLTSDFKPQPWEQLIKVLREMGHHEDASDIAVAKQLQMRYAGVIKGPLRRSLHWLYGLLAGYGHRPLRTLGAMALVWLACSATFYAGRHAGLMGPSDPLIHANPQWEHCGAPGEIDMEVKPRPKPKLFWADGCTLPSEYTTLQPALYSLDLILPLVDLQQEADWSPIVSNESGERLWWGHLLRATMWFEILFGWAMSLMLVAVLGRLVDKD